MTNLTQKMLLTCSVLCLSLTLMVSPAAAETQKHTGSKQVLVAQERLIALGYFVGTKDGVMGPRTIEAIRNFQYRYRLPVTGTLNNETANTLRDVYRDVAMHDGYYHGYYGYNGYNGYHMASYDPNLPPTNALPWNHEVINTPWAQDNTIHVQHVNLHSADMAINEETRDGKRNYSVTVNGVSVLTAVNQPLPIRVSNIANTVGGSDVVFTVADDRSACGEKSFVISVYNDGSFSRAHEVGNCTADYRRLING